MRETLEKMEVVEMLVNVYKGWNECEVNVNVWE